MEQLFIPGSIIADYFYLGLFLLVAASLIAGYVDAIAGGAGLQGPFLSVDDVNLMSDSRIFDGRFTAAGRVGTGKIGEYHRYGGCD